MPNIELLSTKRPVIVFENTHR